MDPDVVLYQSVERGDKRLAEVLLKGGANPNRVLNAVTAFHIAAGKDDVTLLNLLIQYGGDPNTRPSEDVFTPLQVACAFNMCANVELLLGAGGDPSLRDCDGSDCPMLVREAGCDKCTALLQIHMAISTEKEQNVEQTAKEVEDSPRQQNAQDKFEEYDMELHQIDITSPDHPVLINRSSTNSHSSQGDSRVLFEDTVYSVHSPPSPDGSFHTAASGDSSVNTSGADAVIPGAEFEFPPQQRDAAELCATHPTRSTSGCGVSRASAARLSELSDVGGPLHSTVCDFHPPPPPLSVTDLHINTVSSLDLSLDTNVKDQLTINSHSSHSPRNCSALGGSDGSHCEIMDETVSIMYSPETLNLNSQHDFNGARINPKTDKNLTGYLESHTTANALHPNRLKSVAEERVNCRKSHLGGALDGGFSTTRRLGGGIRRLETQLYTDDESTLNAEPRNRYEVLQRCDGLEQVDSGLGSSSTSRKPGHGLTFSDTILSHGDGARIRSRNDSSLLPIHPDFFKSPITSSRIATPDVSVVGEVGAGDACCHGNVSIASLSSIHSAGTEGGQGRQNDHTELSTFDCPSVHTPVKQCFSQRLGISNNSSESKFERSANSTLILLSKKDKASTGNDTQGGSTVLYENSWGSVDGPEKADSVAEMQGLKTGAVDQDRRRNISGCSVESVRSTTSSKASTCSCQSDRKVIEEDDFRLLEVMLSKDSLDCSFHFGQTESCGESTEIYDWRNIDCREKTEQSCAPSSARQSAAEERQRQRGDSTGAGVQSPVTQSDIIQSHVTQSTVTQSAVTQSPITQSSVTQSKGSGEQLSHQPRRDVAVSSEIRAMSDVTLRHELEKRGDRPGPVTVQTRSVYETRLARIMADPQLVKYNTQNDEFCPELQMVLNGKMNIDNDESLNYSLCRMFLDPNPQKAWREGTEKKSFNYLLLDPRVTQNLPARHKHMSETESFETFVKAIFYVGKGKRSRPYQHFKEAMAFLSGTSHKASEKVLTILRIWEAGLGVISLHIFQNVLATEAYTREACMIDALGLKRLTNKQSGQVYCNVLTWPQKKRRLAGVLLLKKAYNIYLNEGERQLRSYDIKAQ